MRVEFERRPDGILVEANGLAVKASWEAEGILRVSAVEAAKGEPLLREGPMLEPGRERAAVAFDLGEDEAEIRMSSALMSLRVDRSTGRFSYWNRRGDLLFRESEKDGKLLEPRPVSRRVFDPAAAVIKQTVDGLKSDSGEGREVHVRDAYRARLGFEFSPREAIYGLGQHEEGKLDYRGRCQYLYQQNMKVAVPFLASSRGWGLLWQGYSAMLFRDDQFGSYLQAECDEEMDFFVIAGDALDDIVRGYRRLTGRAYLPPRWAFGYFQSKERYKSQAELLEVAREYEKRGLVPECMVLDWQTWPGELWGQKSYDPERFPDPEAMAEALRAMGSHLMVSIWPHMHHDGPDQLEMRAAGKLLGNGSTYDAFDAEGRAIYWGQADRGLFSRGVDAWWCDCTEPFEADWNGSVKKSPEERMRINAGTLEKYLDPGMANSYSLLHSKGIWEGQRATGTGKRVLNLTRSAYAGQQRYGTFTWSGDTAATWDTLRRQIPEGLNFCASGLPYWTTDIGAFFVGKKEQWFWRGDYEKGVEDSGYRELFVRWFQYGAFLPMFRAHGTDTPREIWRFGEKGSREYDTLIAFLGLRKSLMSYLYSLAGAVTLDGYTMMRALAFDFMDDERALGVEDEFMLGPELLVCPVTRPQYFGPDSTPLKGGCECREVYLPGRGTWIDFWTGERLQGGHELLAPSPLETIPLYLRSGSILPRDSLAGVGAGGAALELRVYPGADGSFTLYEDEGDGNGRESGSFSRIRLTWIEAERRLVIGAREGSFPGMEARRAFRVSVAGGENEPSRPSTTVEYDGSELSVRP
jgi:alpha-D-xyloside xylohydrolase